MPGVKGVLCWHFNLSAGVSFETKKWGKALEKIGGNPKLAKQQGSKPWFLSQSAQLPKKALHFFSVMSTRPQCQYLSQVPSVHSALQLMQNKDFILLAA